MAAARTAEEIEALCARFVGLMPEAVAEIRRMLAAHRAGLRADPPRVEVTARFRLEKFDGEAAPGKAPVEVIEGEA